MGVIPELVFGQRHYPIISVCFTVFVTARIILQNNCFSFRPMGFGQM